MNGRVEQQPLRDPAPPVSLRALYQWRWRPRWRLRAFNFLVSCFQLTTAWLPDMVRLALRTVRPVVKRLDYADAEVRIHADSWVEYDKRAHSCSKEPETVAWIESHIRPDDVVYDIGANIGAYSLLIAKRLQSKVKVYAFEPSFSTFAQLSRNVALNGVSDAVYPMYVALSDSSGLSFFNYSSLDTGTALHALETDGNPVEFKAVHRQPILSFTLDEMVERFAIPYPNHIKLDVDGIEYPILTGARKVLDWEGLHSIIVESEETRPGANTIHGFLCEAGFELESEHLHNANPLHKGPYVKNCIYRRAGRRAS